MGLPQSHLEERCVDLNDGESQEYYNSISRLKLKSVVGNKHRTELAFFNHSEDTASAQRVAPHRDQRNSRVT